MKLTKYEHSCLVLTKGEQTLVIDPGAYTMPLTDVGGVVGIVITHEHSDHWTAEQLERILDRNEGVTVLGPAGLAAVATGFTVDEVKPGDTREIGEFSLEFTGGEHAVIDQWTPVVDNVGMIVDDLLYYPGDSFALPGKDIDVLALPQGAPWMKTSEALDFLVEVKPRRAFPVHDVVHSQIGKGIVNARFESRGKTVGTEFFVLEPGESTDI